MRACWLTRRAFRLVIEFLKAEKTPSLHYDPATKVRCYGAIMRQFLYFGYPAARIQPEIGHER